MVRGAIKTSDILRHPIILIGLFGLVAYLRLLAKSLSPITYMFLNIMPR